jgi:hypothetical protein
MSTKSKTSDGVTTSAEVSHMQHIIEELAMLRRGMERLPKSPGKDECLKHLAYVERATARRRAGATAMRRKFWPPWKATRGRWLPLLA